MNPTVPRAGTRCANPACGQWSRSRRRPTTARYCSRPCAAAVRPRSSRVLAGRKGGLERGKRLRAMSLAEIRQRVAGMSTLEAFMLGRKYGKADNSNRVEGAKREGFADGYEAAIRDIDLGRSA